MGGCLGCHMSLLDLDEILRDLILAQKIEIVFSPPLIDTREPPTADIFIVEGAVNHEEDLEVIKKVREKCKILVAFGDCACMRGILAMRNLFKKEEALQCAYVETASTKNGKIPDGREVPKLLEKALPVDKVVKVDCYVPGCPPSPKSIKYVLEELLKGLIPKVPQELLHYD
ncbi:MAG: hypothetical protein QXN56_02755 [Candidatus Hadarchaeum sp.]